MTLSKWIRNFGLLNLGLLGCLIISAPASAERIKDLVNIQGVRANQLIGYGLVVGLDGTGDQTQQTPFTVQSILSMLGQLGVNLPPGVNLQLRNVASVMVTATLPAFAKPGQQIDVTVSSMGNAKSLRGGTLLMTPLKGIDNQVYAVAQGSLVIGGAGASSAGSSVQINHLGAGRISAGAIVERAVPTLLGQGEYINLELHDTDFTTARRIVETINSRFSYGTATALDGRVIQLRAPVDNNQRVTFISQIEGLDVMPAQGVAKVIINARTGSVVMNQMVTLEPSAVAHGNLSVIINTQPIVSQPGPFSQRGETVVVPQSQIEVRSEEGNLMLLPGSASLADVVKALNAIGATPQDLLAILQALKAAGSLRAELEII
ncbi:MULTISPECIES: flagellar basal body P-ring protein FlgI [Nitrosomonas]|uniref:Flagellar P-ring protein n=2 Tax=Nitrosomonas eutropha TaxID=916 RepID=A0ABX5M8N1_9PROT|nr:MULTISPECIES: flagellar basal body P-ring protein FlgI [Nitrosomonas]ABI58622.1 flagellar P-ring protein [Nitrosomonas eutropha C91]MXS80429.1 flagellar basal body P-ring protein FlgI [Nitrosomonas sp. GH22]PXV79695.1 flagellar P-ring protein precursor FlgI [Nitrosomonas eutropha]SCX23942.1 flagellar P-ring protein precursor FlgI [Nitrosomonas eutropha]SDW95445.1 flagellar P-ring protein precursor FlgI [Nitrosomonas eutropha]